jgi:hypothetical protein
VGGDVMPDSTTPSRKKIKQPHTTRHQELISWTMLTGADNLILADFPFIVMMYRAFCKDYPINGHLVLNMIIIAYIVVRINDKCTKNMPWISQEDTLSHHFHALNIVIVVIKFILDFATIVLRYDVR